MFLFGNLGRLPAQNAAIARLTAKGISVDLRSLHSGDAVWTARKRSNPSIEYVLDFIVERKRLDDLQESIVDGRYGKQKWAMKRSGLRRPIYLVEGDYTNIASCVRLCLNLFMFQIKYT